MLLPSKAFQEKTYLNGQILHFGKIVAYLAERNDFT